MKVLVTGVGGQLGFDVCRRLNQLGIANKGVDIQDFDLTDSEAVLCAVKDYAPDAIIHCAAYTNVEKAETMLEHAERRTGGAGCQRENDVHQHRLRLPRHWRGTV